MTDSIDRLTDQIDTERLGVPDPGKFPHISVPTACGLVGVAHRTGYAAAQRGEWPVIRVGRAVRVNTKAFLAQYGLVDDRKASS